MARETLVDAGIRLFRDRPRHHLEMHHGVARRRLMTLDAVNGARRGMTEVRDGSTRPCGDTMRSHRRISSGAGPSCCGTSGNSSAASPT